MGDLGADLEQRHHLAGAGLGQLRGDAVERGAGGVRFDVHDGRLEAGRLGDGDPVLDLFAARGRQHDLDVLGRVGGRADDVEVQADLVERERDVLAGLRFDLHFELVLRQAGRQDDFLGDDGRRRHAQRGQLGAAAALFPDAPHHLDHLVHVLDVAVGLTAPRGSGSAA